MCMHMCQIHMYVSICIQCAIVCLVAATHAQSNTLIAVWECLSSAAADEGSDFETYLLWCKILSFYVFVKEIE